MKKLQFTKKRFRAYSLQYISYQRKYNYFNNKLFVSMNKTIQTLGTIDSKHSTNPSHKNYRTFKEFDIDFRHKLLYTGTQSYNKERSLVKPLSSGAHCKSELSKEDHLSKGFG